MAAGSEADSPALRGYATANSGADEQALPSYAAANSAAANFATADSDAANSVTANSDATAAGFAPLDSDVAGSHLVVPASEGKVFPDGFVDRGDSASSAGCFVLRCARWTVPPVALKNGAPSPDLLCSACRSHRQKEVRSYCKP